MHKFFFFLNLQINRWDKPSPGIAGQTNAPNQAINSTFYFSAFFLWQSPTKPVTDFLPSALGHLTHVINKQEAQSCKSCQHTSSQ